VNPEIQELEDILDAILRGVQEVLQSGEIIPDGLQTLIAQEITALTTEIDQLYVAQNERLPAPEGEEELPPEQTPTLPTNLQLNPAPHESSNINSFRYDPENQQLLVKFQGKYPQQNGPVYSYSRVPEYIYDVFRRGAVVPKTSGKNKWHTWKKGVAPSHGASMYALIRTAYPYQRVS